MATIITEDLLKKYFVENKKHPAFQESIELYEKLKVHANGSMPKKLIQERRPSESEHVQKYREAIYKPITEGSITKVLNSLSKIRRSQDWSIKYDKSSVPPSIHEDETPKEYFEYNFPNFDSLTNWVFEMGLKNYCIDANAVVVVMPMDFNVEVNGYAKPYPYIFNSENVLEYVANDYCIVKSSEVAHIVASGETFKGEVWYVITTQWIARYEQSDMKKGFKLSSEPFIHDLGYLPVMKMPGVFFQAKDGYVINKSRISSMVPSLDEAAREYSDLQAEIVQHTHSEKWIYSTQDCTSCNGSGKMSRPEGGFVNCTTCSGGGKVVTSPYSNIVIKPAGVGEQAIPTPPAGYIQKTDVAAMVAIMDKRVDNHLYKALAAINMEFLANVPLSESGIAKQVDRDELNNFVHSVAEDLVRLMDRIIKMSIDYRYMTLVPDKKARKELAPEINVPQVFDLLSTSYLMDELEKARKAGLNPVLIKALEIEFASKKFLTDDEVVEFLGCIYQLDPFGALSSDDKMVISQNDWAMKVDVIISANIQYFVQRAMNEEEDFDDLEYAMKREIMVRYAQEVIDSYAIGANIISGANGGASAADLKYTVGGLTGMIEIAKAIASGLYDLDAGVALVQDRFGLTEEEARKQLGTPSLITSEAELNKIDTLT